MNSGKITEKYSNFIVFYLFTISNFSMVKCDTLYQIDVRLREIKGNSKSFGGVSMVLLGDPLQLRPVRGSYPWEEPKHESKCESVFLKYKNSLSIYFQMSFIQT